MKTEILVLSCDKRSDLWEIWRRCFAAAFFDSPWRYRILANYETGDDLLTIGPDVGFCAGLQTAMNMLTCEYVLLMLDDHLVQPRTHNKDYRANCLKCESFMDENSDVQLIRIGSGYPPESPWSGWDKLGILDRAGHACKRMTLYGPALYRRTFLQSLLIDLIASPGSDLGRDGGCKFEIEGTRITENPVKFPGLFLQTYPGNQLIDLYNNDVYRVGDRIINEHERFEICRTTGLDLPEKVWCGWIDTRT